MDDKELERKVREFIERCDEHLEGEGYVKIRNPKTGEERFILLLGDPNWSCPVIPPSKMFYKD